MAGKPPRQRGLFVVFEGPDGSGKSTQLEMLADRLRDQSHSVVATREPGGTPAGDALREIMLGDANVSMRPLTWVFTMNAARAELVETVIEPALAHGSVVLLDRYWYSTLAYQGAGDGVDAHKIGTVSMIASLNIVPDAVILLDLPVEIGLRRKDSGPTNVLDRRSKEFHERVRRAYKQMAMDDPDRWITVDATQPPDAVHARIAEILLTRCGGKLRIEVSP